MGRISKILHRHAQAARQAPRRAADEAALSGLAEIEAPHAEIDVMEASFARVERDYVYTQQPREPASIHSPAVQARVKRQSHRVVKYQRWSTL